MKYDIIVAGGGCAGLSLLVRMSASPHFAKKKILLIDRELKSTNDRTWCFWEKGAGLFESVVCKSWDQLHFHGENFSRALDIRPYRYKMIRGIDFYRHCHAILKKAGNVDFVIGDLEKIENKETHVSATVDGTEYPGDLGFNSILREKPEKSDRYYFLQQHFMGWIIHTEKAAFEPGQATLMDFRIGQEHGTTFVYVLPFAENRALVEYTLFTRDLLDQESYRVALKEYIHRHLGVDGFRIEEEEFGIIPMTNFPFRSADGNIVNIGTAGGQTKPSSGYTFQFIQKHTQQIVTALEQTDRPDWNRIGGSKKFKFYDSILLRLLDQRAIEGRDLFTDLFKNGDPQTVLKFLDNETNFSEDLNIMRRLPKRVFTKAAIREILRMVRLSG